MTGVDRMRRELVKGRLRKNCQQAIITLIAADIDENDARLTLIAALDELLRDLRREWMEEGDKPQKLTKA